MCDKLESILNADNVQGRSKLVLAILTSHAKNGIVTFHPSWLQKLTSFGERTLQNRLASMEYLGQIRARTAPFAKENEEQRVTYEITWSAESPNGKKT